MPAESAVIVVSLLVLCMASFDRVLCIDNDALWRGSQVQIIDGFNDALVASNYHHLFVDNQRDHDQDLDHNVASLSDYEEPDNIPDSERRALHDLFESTNGKNWIWKQKSASGHWNFTDLQVNPCVSNAGSSWEGITCDVVNTTQQLQSSTLLHPRLYHISKIKLPSYNLEGSIPESIEYLSYLLHLDLSSNVLVGSIPLTIANTTRMQQLKLFNNQMRGSLPSGIYNLSQLVNISIANNSFTGSLSDSISRLYNLQYLSISSNKFDGTIPLSIANLSALAYLDIGVNSFVGRIPDSIGNLTQVTTIKLNKNKLSHSIPEAIGNLTQLKYLDLGDNLISKTIPASIVRCSALQRLDVGNNSLTGTLPSYLGSLTKLTYISLRYNYYIGSMPSSYANLLSLTSFRMNNNAITGSLPSFIGDMLSMGYFSFRYNNFSGSIPSSYSRLAAMQVFKVNHNLLTGSIPSFLGSLSKLNYLEVGNNFFVGSIPSSFSSLSLMGLLSLNYNMLTSTVPTFLGYLSYLYVLDLSGNAFEGTIPSTLQHLSKLANFGFASNLLTGTIPDIFTSLPLMTGVFLDDNLLSGTIPASLSTLPDLVGCFLENNLLTGPVTTIFNPVIQKSLADIQISNNQLTGALSFGNGEGGGGGGFESLSSFSAVTNCFSSADVSMICHNTQLQTLSWDGLSSASSCRHKILPGVSSAYKTSYLIGGTLPACLFDMQQLTVLHLSGNGFIGSLPRIVSVSNALTDLSLSYNFLTGSIPSVLQSRSWSKLDLSYNRLSGTLRSFNPPVNSSDDGYILMLKNNRLSGDIPQAAIDFVTISILDGNLFACKTDRSDLPTRDDARSSYVCGSDGFNSSYYLWLTLIGVVLVVASCLYFYRGQAIVMYVDLASIKKHVLRWNNIQHHIDIHNNQQHPTSKERIILMSGYQQYDVIQSLLVRGAIYASAFITVVLLPTYCILRAYFSTHTYEYAWTVSATSLSGKESFGVLMSLWCSLIVAQLVGYKYCLSGFDIVFPVKQHTQVYDSRFVKRWLIYTSYVVFNLMIVAGVNAAYVLAILKSSSSAKVFAQIALSIFKLAWNDGVSPTTVRWILHFISVHGYDHKYSFKRMLFLQLFTALNVNIIIPYLAVMIISTNCFYYALNSRSTINSSYSYQSCQEFTNEQCTTEVQVEAHTSYAPPFVYNYQCSAGIITSYASVYVYVSIFSTFFIPMGKLLLLKLHKSSVVNSRLFHVTYFFLPHILRPFSREPEGVVVTTTISNGCMETLQQHHRKTASGLMDGGSTDDIISPPSPLPMKDNMSTIKAVASTATTADGNSSSSSTVQRDLLHPYYNANQIVNTNFLTVALILTFGVVFPPLALCLAISSMVRLKFIQLSVGRLIINSIEARQLSYLRIVDEECDKVVSERVFMNCIFMVLGVCCCFYSMFLFDTLGDTVGFYQSYWVLIVMFVLPACLYGTYRVVILLYQAPMMMIHTNHQSSDKANIEMSSFQSNNPMIEV